MGWEFCRLFFLLIHLATVYFKDKGKGDFLPIPIRLAPLWV